MTPHPPAVFFLSDYGTSDEFVGVVHAVLHRLAPDVSVIDLSHQIPVFDVAAGASMLERSVAHLGPGVVLAVVDPGVGTRRRAVAVAIGAVAGDVTPTRGPGAPSPRGSPGWLVGPDNGLLVPAAEALGGPVRVIDLGSANTGDRPNGSRSGPTFDGRDLFAPAAAHLALGGDPGALGPDADPSSLVGSDPVEPPAVADAAAPAPPGGGTVMAPVGWVDRFGNAQLRVTPAALADSGIVAPGGWATVTVLDGPTTGRPADGGDPAGRADGPVPARWVNAFGDLGPGELGLITDANGWIALVADRASAAHRLGISGSGATVQISARPPGG